MSFIASEYINPAELQRFAVVSTTAADARRQIPFMSWLKEYRTFSIGLPRQVGKTTALMSSSTESTVIIFPTHLMLNYARRRSSVSAGLYTPDSFVEFASSLLVSSTPTKLTQIFIDEVDYVSADRMQHVLNAIDTLQQRGRLADNVFILKVGTPLFC